MPTANEFKPYWFGYAVIFAIATAGLIPYYPGSPLVFIGFSLCYLCLLGLAIPGPRYYVYTFFAGLMFLGFWSKVAVHSLWPSNFIDPVGDFLDTGAEWDDSLIVAACGAIGVMLPRIAQLWKLSKRRPDRDGTADMMAVPGWYAEHRRLVWTLTLVLAAAVNILNYEFAFFQVGTNPRMVLPFHLNAAVIWLLNVGFSLAISMLVYWDWTVKPLSLPRALVVPMIEALCSSVTVMSRLVYLLHAGPYLVALWEKWHSFKSAFSMKQVLFLTVTFAIGFWLSIGSVFSLRAKEYYPYAENKPPQDTVVKHVERTVKSQLPQLFVHRWVGLEGVLAVGALKQRNTNLFVAALTEKPESGVKALYQRVAKLNFQSKAPDKFTFLSNAGPVALLYFSGSLLVVMFGMSLATLCLFATEYAARRWLGNPLFLAVSSAALANVLAQTTVPYLSLVFFAQIWFAIAFFATLQNNATARTVFGYAHGAGTR